MFRAWDRAAIRPSQPAADRAENDEAENDEADDEEADDEEGDEGGRECYGSDSRRLPTKR